MATATAPVVLTPTEDMARLELNQLGIAMIQKLSTFPNGQPGKVAEVAAFQQAWDKDKAEISSMLKKVGSPVQWWQLTIDGLWGKNTASALAICCLIPGTTPPPLRSAEIPAWYAQNQSLINQAMLPNVPPQTTVSAAIAPPISSSPVPAAPAAQTVVSTAKDGTAVVIQASSSTPPVTAPKTVNKATTTKTVVQAPMVPASAAADIRTAGAETATPAIDTGIDFTEGSTIIAAPVRSRTGWIAAGIGAVVLGGALLAFTSKRRRHA